MLLTAGNLGFFLLLNSFHFFVKRAIYNYTAGKWHRRSGIGVYAVRGICVCTYKTCRHGIHSYTPHCARNAGTQISKPAYNRAFQFAMLGSVRFRRELTLTNLSLKTYGMVGTSICI